MNELLVGYARVSTEQQDLTSQRNCTRSVSVMIASMSITANRHRRRPSRSEFALATCRADDTLLVTKLDRLTRKLRGRSGCDSNLSDSHQGRPAGAAPVGVDIQTRARRAVAPGEQAADRRGEARLSGSGIACSSRRGEASSWLLLVAVH
jgi:Resolvase, N terminal domain